MKKTTIALTPVKIVDIDQMQPQRQFGYFKRQTNFDQEPTTVRHGAPIACGRASA